MATVWLTALLRFVNSTIRKNARRGGSGMSQIKVSVVMKTPLCEEGALWEVISKK